MNIPGFDPSTMTYLATQMQHPNVSVGLPSEADRFQDMMLPTEYQDHQSAYGGYAGSEDYNLRGVPSAPPMKRFASAYEDQYSDVVSAFDTSLVPEMQETEVPASERDEKLLRFSLTSLDFALLDYNFRQTTININAQIHGMFFVAESTFPATEQAPEEQFVELTCYRRNLFQITGEVTLPRTLHYIHTEQGEQIPILSQELVISATESTEGNPVKIISVPWKTPVGPGVAGVEEKGEREPPTIPLETSNAQDMHQDFSVTPFQWKRLQFRIATANNGRRKELQQHFVVRLKVMATLSNGARVAIAQVQSGPIIVRGRSPRNFQSRKELPLNGNSTSRKQLGMPGRSTSAESVKQVNLDGPTSIPRSQPNFNAQPAASSFYEHAEMSNQPDAFDTWLGQAAMETTNHHHTGAMTAIPAHHPGASVSYPQHSGNVYAISSPEVTGRAQKPTHPTSTIINLSLMEDDSPTGLAPLLGRQTSTSATPEAKDRTAKRVQIPPAPPRPPSFSLLNTLNSPDESADLLYEYFPLGVDDWLPPVDAVYRPHGVHHVKLPTDPRDPTASGTKARGKRLYVEEVD